MLSAFTTGNRRAALTIPVLFTSTIFLSASLLFFVQPLFARIVLPHIGGAPAVWTTAMLFFQTVLIGGYLYAHLSTRYLGLRTQVVLHLVLWAAALTFLPLSIAEGWRYDAAGSTVGQTLALFATGVGLPFAVLSANAPLIQSWYARTDGPSAEDPYFLYGASNLGSLVALLAFPLAAEPLFGATRIGIGWAAGFVLLGGFLCLSGFAARPGAGAARVADRTSTSPAPGWRTCAGWALMAFVPSSLMLALTSKISTDVGAIPLVWVVPLSLYLLTFVLTFTNRPLLSPRALRSGFVFAIAVLSFAFSGLLDAHLSLWAVAAMIAAFFAVALFAHRRLYEGPITVAVAALLLIGARNGNAPIRKLRAKSLILPALAGIATIAIVLSFTGLRFSDGSHFRDRSFFGAHEVRDEGALRVYRNGTTIHGAERRADLGAARPEPLFYYHRNGPMAQVLTSEVGLRARRVGIVGLGVGALACYRQPGQDWHFYEIDATVDRVARDPSLFTFLSACAPDAPTHMGDARIVLSEQADMKFDVLVIDAYSSDSVPLHLTTTEAMALYRDRLAPGGVLVYHISNRYFAIHRPLARSAAALGLTARVQFYPGHRAEDPADVASRAVIVAGDAADFGPLAGDPRWQRLPDGGGRLWTDDYANLLSILY